MLNDRIEYLRKFVTQKRIDLLNDRISKRTKYLTVCLENIYQTQNAGAVVRTCDAFGIQDVHIIENVNQFCINGDVTLGTEKWVNIHRHNNSTEEVISELKKAGYRIVATLPNQKALPLNDFDVSKGKTALMFGTELTGLSDEAIKMADEFLYIPMCGFVESLNISVSAAVCIYDIMQKLKSSDTNWRLTPNEHNELMYQWLLSSARSPSSLLKHFDAKNANA